MIYPLQPLRLDVGSVVLGSPPLIDLDTVKAHCRIDGTDEDALLAIYLTAAIQWAEDTTHRTIFERAHSWFLREFPCDWRQEINLPRGKTQSIRSIAYSANGAGIGLTGPSSPVPGTDYQEDLRGDDGGVIMPPRGGTWPTVDCDVPAPVAINFTAGWEAADVPAPITHAILFAVEDMFDVRGTADFQPAMVAAGGPRLAAREALISGYRLSRWY